MEVIEPILNYQKVSYEKLKELINVELIKDKIINIYVNMNSVINYFYAPATIDAMNSLRKLENVLFVPEFINLLAHYRHYFYSRFGCSTRFFIYYMNKEVVGKDDYCTDMLDRMSIDNIKTGMMNDILISNMNMIETMCKYLQNIYFIKSDGIEPSLIPYHIIKKLSKRENECNIVMTHDYYDYQLLNLEKTIILSAAGNRSKVYTRDNIYYKKMKNIKYEMNNALSPELFTLIMSLTGYNKRNIDKLDKYGFSKCIKTIDNLLENNLMNNRYNSSIQELAILFNVDYDKLLDNFNKCDLKLNHKLMNSIDENIITRNLINLQDNDTIMYINSNYFPYNNIKLVELEEGEYIGR